MCSGWNIPLTWKAIFDVVQHGVYRGVKGGGGRGEGERGRGKGGGGEGVLVFTS